MFPDMLIDFERKLNSVKALVQELENFPPIIKHECSKQQEIRKLVEFQYNSDAWTTCSTAPFPDRRNKTEPLTLLTAPASPADDPRLGQQFMQSVPVAQAESVRYETLDVKPDVNRILGRKRGADDSAMAQSHPDPKRALIRAEPERNDTFAIFNYNGNMKGMTPGTIAHMLPSLVSRRKFKAADIEIMSPLVSSACMLSFGGRDKLCLMFKVHGLMAEHLRNWINSLTYVEQSHLENTNMFTNPANYSYILNCTGDGSIPLFSLLFLTAQEIRDSLRLEVKMAPDYLKLRDETGSRKMLTLTELMSNQWISVTRNAFGKMTHNGKNAVRQRIAEMGYSRNALDERKERRLFR